MQIGILQTGPVAEPLATRFGQYGDMFRRRLEDKGFTFRVYDVTRGEFPADPRACDGWLITGSRHGVYEDHPWIAPLEAFIREIVAARRPLVGVCFGHQIIARALGGRVEKAPGGWIVGRQEYRRPDGSTVPFHAWHQDQVLEPPPGAEVILTHPACPYAGLAIGETVRTIQAHPEFEADYLRGLLEHRAPGIVPEPLRRAALESAEGPVAGDEWAEEVAAFFRAHAPEKREASDAV